MCGALIVAACSGSDDTDTATDATAETAPSESTAATDPPATDPPATEPPESTTTELPATPADAATVAAIEQAIGGAPEGCDPLDTQQCLLPFPSDAYLVEDASTASGNRVNMPAGGLPVNSSDVPIDPAAWNLHDGFSANASLLTYVADLDPSNLPAWTDLGASLDDGATVVLVDTTSGERIPLWAEPDAGSVDYPEEQLLVIHPAVSLEPATTYVVGLRGLNTNAGEPIQVSRLFEAYRDNSTTEIEPIESRRDSMQAGFVALEQAGVARDDLQLAWTFTTASTENTTAGILEMRDETMVALGDSTPEFQVTAVNEDPENPGLARFVEGTYSVPNYLTGDGSPGSALNIGADGLPAINEENATLQSPFACEISATTLAGTEPAHMVQYGHGLLGSWDEVDAGNIVAMSNEHNTVYCATKWAGFSEDDVPTAVAALSDMNNFPTFIDRMSQGLLNQLVLGRLMLADNGLVAEPAFWFADGTPLIDNSELVYDGNSQGGIMGMALAGISQDFTRAVLGVVGQNYSTLLPRSIDFDTYEEIFIPSYPSNLDRELLLSVIQMEWDQAEGAGYVRNIVSDTLPDTPEKVVLMHVAFGDHQVSELTAMIAARTMGVPIHRPVTADGRSAEIEPGWGIDTLEYGSAESGLIIWDSGAPPIPFEQTAPTGGNDPHSDPRNDANVRMQKAAFLFDGELIDVCNAGACTAAPGD
jgi:hypothetical protein